MSDVYIALHSEDPMIEMPPFINRWNMDSIVSQWLLIAALKTSVSDCVYLCTVVSLFMLCRILTTLWGKYLQPGKVEMLGSSQFPVAFNIPKSNYYFVVGKPGYRIVIEFLYIDLPDGQQDCHRNYVGVRDGFRGPMLAHLCGPTDRVQFSTNGMVMRIDMASAPTQNTRGFLAKAWIEQA